MTSRQASATYNAHHYHDLERQIQDERTRTMTFTRMFLWSFVLPALVVLSFGLTLIYAYRVSRRGCQAKERERQKKAESE